MRKIVLSLIIGIFILVGTFFVFSNQLSLTGRAVEELGILEIPLVEISSQAKFYDYDYNGVNIKYFAVKANDGIIKTAFDACDVCFGSQKGYRQEGEFMICNNCGNKYPISGLGTENKVVGGCWPSYLPNEIQEDVLIIQESDLIKGGYKFK